MKNIRKEGKVGKILVDATKKSNTRVNNAIAYSNKKVKRIR